MLAIPAGLSDVRGVPLSEASPLVSFGLGTGVEESLALNRDELGAGDAWPLAGAELAADSSVN